MNSSVIVVDNAEADRYIARRRFSRSDGFGQILECENGTEFLGALTDISSRLCTTGSRVIVLMDISMPGRDGFQTIEDGMRVIHETDPNWNVDFWMYTSSGSTVDREQAASNHAIKGFIQKPMRKEDVEMIRSFSAT
jgi:CheY-like chemotaxis protein